MSTQHNRSIVLLFFIAMCLFYFLCFHINSFSQNKDTRIDEKYVDPAIQIAEAENYYFNGNYGEAIPNLRRLIKVLEASENFDRKKEFLQKTRWLTGACYLRNGQVLTAKAIFKVLLKTEPDIQEDKYGYGGDILQSILAIKVKNLEQIELDKIKKEQQQLKEEVYKKPTISPDIIEAKQIQSQSRNKVVTEKIKVRVMEPDAVLRLEPDNKSIIIRSLPIGAVLNVIQIKYDWVKIELLPNKDGIIIVGYIHSKFVKLETNLINK